nr:hypothetical protein [Candidatus Sigynarchaeum springense]
MKIVFATFRGTHEARTWIRRKNEQHVLGVMGENTPIPRTSDLISVFGNELGKEDACRHYRGERFMFSVFDREDDLSDRSPRLISISS